MISGHDPNPIFFNKKNKDWTSRIFANPPHPLHPITSHFALPLPVSCTIMDNLLFPALKAKSTLDESLDSSL